ncbi:protein of unknown function [Candidatus Promineifilum breve]|uniref:Uncharacterized protein n=1 Tax=Candidatus Promineifilum breve TaxID=1806508 RepID=A0A160T072_9CHLR|nr:protein of unknown function [Candidatus Promineifilum breve]
MLCINHGTLAARIYLCRLTGETGPLMRTVLLSIVLLHTEEKYDRFNWLDYWWRHRRLARQHDHRPQRPARADR